MTDIALPIEFGADGLVPAVIVDATSGDVLMVGFMNREALDRTRETGQVHFWSRGRQKLWRKGETSGHTQTVREIRVNCEENSLLIEVDQTGAVCHEGYATCYYRRLEADNSLTVIRDRVFDPADVYRSPGQSPGLGEVTRTQFAAYQFLAHQPLIPESRTSALLHASDDNVTTRITDEMTELAGVLDGSHGHRDPQSDAALEAGQIIYWLTLRCVREGVSCDEVRPDRALDASEDAITPRSTVARLLRSEAAAWTTAPAVNAGSEEQAVLASRVHATMALVGQALGTVGIDPKDVIARDLAELRSKPYLAPFFASIASHQQP